MSDERPVVGVTKQVVEALKVSPALLVLVLLNMAFFAVAGYLTMHFEDARQKVTEMVLERCLKGGSQ